ncbi:MAG: IseA DL-endopeptidase inhibitor family protein, partial [Oscillospiraceae bacterium]|nr:IseA DL-endopeptidase inhibitor family protein [Oscillospiraceae bacterium]
MKKRFWAVLAVVLGMTGCKANADANQTDIEQAALENRQTTTEQTNEQISEIIETTTETTTSTTITEEVSEDMWYNVDIDLSGDYEFGREYEFDLDKFFERAYTEKYLLRDELEFLNDEQYDTYIRAWIFIDCMDDANGSTLPSTNSVRENWCYYHETGLYSFYVSTYESFYEYLRTVFTKEAADKIMSSKHFYNADGELFYITGEAGGYLERIEDKYELVEKNDSEVIFEYNARHIYDNGTYGYEDGTYIETTSTNKLLKE